MATFSDIILQAIFNYRQLLKRQLPVNERRVKLRALGLGGAIDPANETLLYELGSAILTDLKVNVQTSSSTYYSYSGIQKFTEHLTQILDEHDIQEGQVIHKARQASRALLHAIQALMNFEQKPNDHLRKTLSGHAQVIASHGSEEQHHRFRTAVRKFLGTDQLFFGELLQDFEQAL